MTGLEGSQTIARPQARPIGREECVSFALKWILSGDIEDLISGFLKPMAKVLLFALPLGVKEAAHYNGPIAFKSRIGGEDHIRRARLRLNQNNACDFSNCFI